METSTPIERQKVEVKFKDKKVSSRNLFFPSMPVSLLNNTSLLSSNQSEAASPTKTLIFRLSLDSLPKLKVATFDRDPIRWSDWISIFQSILVKKTSQSRAMQRCNTPRMQSLVEQRKQ